MEMIYPKGSIITKKEDNKEYCIVKIKEESYDCILYPPGISLTTNHYDIHFNEVDKLLFWGYIDNEIKEELKNKYLDILMKRVDEK